MMSERKFWIGVAAANHMARGKAGAINSALAYLMFRKTLCN
jgi:hypothetical protein